MSIPCFHHLYIEAEQNYFFCLFGAFCDKGLQVNYRLKVY